MRYLGVFVLVLVFFCGGCRKDSLVPVTGSSKVLNHDYWGIDTINKIIVYNGDSPSIINNTVTIGNYSLEIDTEDEKLVIGKPYSISLFNAEYELYYTQLPIICINTDAPKIFDDPKVSGTLKLFEKNKEPFNLFIGIELRGGVSQHSPKKSYSLELWNSETGESKLKTSLLGMRNDDDWILDGMWNEPNRIRDFTSHEIWLEMARVQNPKSKTKLGISREYCELFLNGRYSGVYYLGEKIDRKQLDLEKYDNEINGELYKGSSWIGGETYKFLFSYDNSQIEWNGYEAKYPKDIGAVDWSILYNHVDFVINCSQQEFNTKISKKIDIDNAIDYYIFLNLIYATDNTGKNVYTGRFDSSSLYFFVAWDMDGSFGNNWEGKRVNVTNKLLSNGLYDKLLVYPQFKEALKVRWSELRNGVLENDTLIKRFIHNNDYLENNAIHMREARVPELPQNYSEDEISFIQSWIERRCTYLDTYFNGL